MKKKGRLLIALAIVIVMTLSIVLMACDDTGFKVTFVTNEGTTVAELTNCKTIETEPTTSRAGYTFKGWYTNAELSGDKVTFPFTVTADTTLYASWEKNADEPDPEEPDVPKFTSAGQVFNTAATMLYSTLTEVIESLNSKTLGYDVNAVVGVNNTKYHFDLATAINLDNVGVGALVNFESITGDVSNSEISLQVYNGDIYYKNGDKALKMPFLGIDSLLALVVGEGIDISAITGAWDNVEDYIGLLGGVLFNEAFTYDKATNSATISVSNDVLAGKLDTIFGLLPGSLNIQQIIDELAYNSLGIPYEINLKEIVSAFNFNLELTLDLKEDDTLEGFSVVLTLGESNLEFKRLASCPTYDADGNRTVVYDRKAPVGEETEGEIITKQLNITANDISFDIAFNNRTTEIAAPEGEYDEVSLINFDIAGKVFLRDSTGTVSDFYMDLLVKSNIDITKLITIVDGKIVPNTAEVANAGYFRLNLTAPEQTLQANEKIGVKTEIVFDPANSGDTNIYIYIALVGGNPFTLTYNMNDLIDYIISNQQPVVTPTEPEVQALANSNIADTAINGLISLINKFIGSTVVTGNITFGDILNGIDYSYENGLSVKLNFIDEILKPIVGDMLSKALILGSGRDSVVVKIENISMFTAESGYNAYDLCKNLAYVKDVELKPLEVNYGDVLSNHFTGKNKDTIQSKLSLTDGTELDENNFVVLKTEGYNPTQAGTQKVTVYGFAVKKTEFIFGMVLGFVQGIPFGMFKITLNVTVREQLEIEKNSVSVSVNELIQLSSTDKKKALGAKMSYTYNGTAYEENVDNSNITFLDSDQKPIDDITAIGTYYARVNMYTLTIDTPFTVYSTTLPSSSFAAGTFTYGISIEDVIGQYSYSYLNDKGETVTVNFSLDNVDVTQSSSSNESILDANGAIVYQGTSTAYLKFTININNDTVVISKSTGRITQPAQTVIVNEQFNTVYDNGSLISDTFTSIVIYGSKGQTGKTLFPMLVVADGVASLILTTKKGDLDTQYGTVTSFKIFDGENDITSSILDTSTGKFNRIDGLDNSTDKKLTVAVTFTSPDGDNEYANATYSFSSEFTFNNIDYSLKFNEEMTTIKDSTLLDGMISRNRIANGLLSTPALKYVDGKYIMAYYQETFGDVTITVKDSSGNDVTSTVLVDGKFTAVTADTKYTVTFVYTPAEGSTLPGGTVTQEITVTPSVFDPTLKLNGTPSLVYGQVIELPLIYMDKHGVNHEIILTFEDQVVVDMTIDWNTGGMTNVYEYKKFVLKNAADNTYFTDGRRSESDAIALPIFATVVSGDHSGMAEIGHTFYIDQDTGVCVKELTGYQIGTQVTITVTIFEKEFTISDVLAASDPKQV